MTDGNYLGPSFLKKINEIKIWYMIWVPDLKWQPGQEIPNTDPKQYPPITCIGVGVKYKCLKNEEIPEIVSRLKAASGDISIGDVIVPRDITEEVAEELDRRYAALLQRIG